MTLGDRLGRVDAGVAPSSAPRAYALRTRANAFGYNAAEWKAMSVEFKKNYLGATGDLSADQKKEWPDFVAVSGGSLVIANAAQSRSAAASRAALPQHFAPSSSITQM